MSQPLLDLTFVRSSSHSGLKKTIAIIGSSHHTDHSLVNRLAALGYPLLLADQQWEQVKQCILSQHPEAFVEIIDCSLECAWQADMVLLYPSEEYKNALDAIKNVVTGKVIVHLANDFKNKEVQHLLPFSKVVTAVANSLKEKVSYTIGGQSNQAVQQVLLLFDEIGFKSKVVAS
jgi:predicted dinucleotide-binding enzyme